MQAPSVIVRLVFAWLGPTSVQWAAGRWRRALFWDVAMLAAMLACMRITPWPIAALALAQIVDAAIIRPARARSTGGYAIAMLIAFCVSILVAVTLRVAWVEAFKIPAGSMIPTLEIGDHMFVDKTARTPRRGDIIVFKYPKEPAKDFVKRVIAIGGDTIEIRANQLVLNGTPVPRRQLDEPCAYEDYFEEYDRWETTKCEAWEETIDGRSYRIIFDLLGSPHDFPARTIPPGHVYVLGDNRDNSHDSRYWGTVPPENVKGTARVVWWSEGRNGVRWKRFNRPLK